MLFTVAFIVAPMVMRRCVIEGLDNISQSQYDQIQNILQPYDLAIDVYEFNNQQNSTKIYTLNVSAEFDLYFEFDSENLTIALSTISGGNVSVVEVEPSLFIKKIFIQQLSRTFRPNDYEQILIDENGQYDQLLTILDRTTPYFSEIIQNADMRYVLWDDNNSLQIGPAVTASNWDLIYYYGAHVSALNIQIGMSYVLRISCLITQIK